MGRRFSLLSLPVAGWVLYDFANTIFSYAVLTRFFNDWIVIELDRPDWYVGAMGACVSLALLLALPFMGQLADYGGRRKPYLVAFTLLCAGATVALGLIDGVAAALAVGAVAIFAFNCAEAQYHPLLASVAPPERRGRVSGVGVSVGYVGGLFALVLLSAIVGEDEQRAFLPTGALMLAFALPCFLWVRERGPERGVAVPIRAVPRAALERLVASVAAARGRPHGRFLVARFLYVDTLATVIAFVAVYARRVSGFTSAQVDVLLILAAVSAILGGIVAGLATERLGPKAVLSAVLTTMAATLALVAASGSGLALWVLAPVAGASLAAVWASDRVLLLRIVPREHRGEAFGLYSLVGRVSSGVGPLVLWGGTIWLLSDALALTGEAVASRAALGVLAATALAGLAVLRPLSDADPEAALAGLLHKVK